MKYLVINRKRFDFGKLNQVIRKYYGKGFEKPCRHNGQIEICFPRMDLTIWQADEIAQELGMQLRKSKEHIKAVIE